MYKVCTMLLGSIVYVHGVVGLCMLYKCALHVILWLKSFLYNLIDTTKGRDRFHWAATPLKPYKVGNICYMTYRYSLLYFLNLSLKHFFSHRKRQFLWKYPNPETVIVSCFNAFALAQSKVDDIVQCMCISLLN